MNELIRLTEYQSVKQEHPCTITACAYRCPEKQLTIDYVVKTSITNKSYLVIKTYENTYTKHNTQKADA